MNPYPRATLCVLLPLLTFAATVTHAAGFEADLVMTRSGQVTTGAFQSQDQNYRFDFVENGRKLIVIGDGQRGVTRLLAPAENSYAEARADEPMSLVANPFSAFAYLSRTKTVRNEGTETIAGVPCRKQVVLSGEQVWLTGWVSADFNVPLKVEIPIYALTVELKNIRQGPQDAALFAVPAGYRLNTPEPEPVRSPDWAASVADARLLTPPCEETVADGGIVRVRTQAGRSVKVDGTNLRTDEGSFTVLPFKGGKSLGTGEMATTMINGGDTGAITIGSQPKSADEIAIRVGSGPMKLKIAYVTPGRAFGGSTPSPDAPPAESPTDTTEPTAALIAPAEVNMASRFEVSWTGPGGTEDTIVIAKPSDPPRTSVSRARVREGNPLKIFAPSDPGQYEIRYLQARTAKPLTTAPLTVNAVTAAVKAPGAGNVASRIEVSWEGPAADGDFISIARRDQPPSTATTRAAVRTGNPVALWLPSDAGDYEVRYVLGRGLKLLARAPVTVNPVTATIEPPAVAKAGKEFEIRWTGPGYPEDFISVAQADQPPGRSAASVKVKPGGTLTLRAPRQAGTYEVRYVLGRGPRLLASAPIKIEPAD